MTRAQYIINEEKRMVICIIDNDRNEFCDMLDNTCRYKNICISFDYDFVKSSLYIKDHYKGVAKCSPNDKFDIELGKKIALTRAQMKRDKDIKKAYNNYVNELAKIANSLNKKANIDTESRIVKGEIFLKNL